MSLNKNTSCKLVCTKGTKLNGFLTLLFLPLLAATNHNQTSSVWRPIVDPRTVHSKIVDSDIDEQEDAFEGGLEASPFDSPKGGHGYFNDTKDEIRNFAVVSSLFPASLSDDLNKIKDKLSSNLNVRFPIFSPEGDLLANTSLSDHFNHIVRTSRRLLDQNKADIFLRNVMHVIDLSIRDYERLHRYKRGHETVLDVNDDKRITTTDTGRDHQRKMVIIVSVVLAVLAMAVLFMIFLVIKDGRRTGFSRPIRKSCCWPGGWTRQKVTSSTRPLPPLPYHPGRRIDLPPSFSTSPDWIVQHI